MSNANENSSNDSASTASSNGSRFSRGLITRIVAVTLFLAVGTFAVTQSLKSRSKAEVAKKESDKNQNPDDKKQASTNPDSSETEQATPKVDQSAFGTNFQVKPASDTSKKPASQQGIGGNLRLPNTSASNPPNTRFQLSDTTSPRGQKKADLAPTVNNPRKNPDNATKNRVAKPIVGKQDNGTESSQFAVQPRSFQTSSSATDTEKKPAINSVTQDKPKTTPPANPGLQDFNRRNNNTAPAKSSFGGGLERSAGLPQPNTGPANSAARDQSARNQFGGGANLAQPRNRTFPADSGAFNTSPKTQGTSSAGNGIENRSSRNLASLETNDLRNPRQGALNTPNPNAKSAGTLDSPLARQTGSSGNTRPNTELNLTNPRAKSATDLGSFNTNRNTTPPAGRPVVPSGVRTQLGNHPTQGSGTRAGFESPTTDRNQFGNQPPRNNLNQPSNFNQRNLQVQPSRQDPNQRATTNNLTPPANRNLGGSLTPNRQLSGQGSTTLPTTQGSQRLPAQQAGFPRSLPPSAGSVRTLPTPGEKELEGARTPSLTIQRVAPREIQLNTPATFEVVVRNVGKVAANDVRVYDQIPTGTQLLEATPQPNENARGSVQWNLGSIAPGQERRIKLKLRATQPGEIGSVAQVTFATQSSIRTLVTKPVLEITHSAPKKSLIGDRVPLDIVVTNKGNGPAHQVIIQEDIPQQLEYSDGFRQIEYEVGTLAPGQSRKLQLVLKAKGVGKLKNVIHANGRGGLRSQHAVDMEVVAPKLAARSNGPRRRHLRRKATHDFSVQNSGTAKATNVELMAKLPPGLKFVEANNRGQYDSATNAVYWSLAELDAGVTANVSLTTVPVATGAQDIDFTAVADLKQKASAKAGLTVEHLVDVFFDIDDIVDHIEIGAQTQYQIRIVNQGTKTATNIRLQVDFSNGVRPQSVDGGIQSQIQGQRVVFAPITSMNPGDEIKVTVNAIGQTAGEHKVIANMTIDGRQTPVSKEETTQVYADR